MEWISVVLDINPTNKSNDRIRVVSFEKKRNQEHNESRCILVSLHITDYRSNDISSFGIVLIELMYTIILDVPLFNLLLGRYWHETMDDPLVFLMFVKKKELRSALLLVFLVVKREDLWKKSHTNTDEVKRSFQFVIRLDSFEEKFTFITLHLCTFQ